MSSDMGVSYLAQPPDRERIFSIRQEAFQFSDKKLNDELTDVRHRLMKGSITGDEAKKRGRQAYVEAVTRCRANADRVARSQGFERCPVDLFPDALIEQSAREWEAVVDEILRLLLGARIDPGQVD